MSVSIQNAEKQDRRSRSVTAGTARRRSLMDWMGSFGTEDIGVDLGTSNMVVYVRDKGIVLDEPSVVAVCEKTGEMMAAGHRADAMEGRTPRGIKILRPLRESAIVDYGAAAYLLSSLLEHMSLKSTFFHPRLVMCVPSGVTGVQRRALLESAVAMGARKTVLIEQPMAAVMGTGLDTSRMVGAMVVDIGGGSANISVLSRYGIVVSSFSPDAGMVMDQAIMAHVRDKYRVRIGRKAAESAKIELGAWFDAAMTHSTSVSGASVVTGLPMKLDISSGDVSEALKPIVDRIFRKILEVLQKTPPALLADIRDHGILMTGGVSCLKGLDMMITRTTGIPAYVVEYPFFVNAIGAGNALEYMDIFRDSLQNLH